MLLALHEKAVASGKPLATVLLEEGVLDGKRLLDATAKWLDLERVEHVVMNLLVNARDALVGAIHSARHNACMCAANNTPLPSGFVSTN